MPYPRKSRQLSEEKTAYPNNITPQVHLLGINGKDAALSES